MKKEPVKRPFRYIVPVVLAVILIAGFMPGLREKRIFRGEDRLTGKTEEETEDRIEDKTEDKTEENFGEITEITVSDKETDSSGEDESADNSGAGKTTGKQNEKSVGQQGGKTLPSPEVPDAFDLSCVPPFDGRAWADVNEDIPFFTEEEMETARLLAASAQTGTGSQYQIYGPLDSLGRCTGACALVGPETLPEEERGNISSVKPTGWHTASYDEIEGGYLYNRCHLIGFQLTGQNVNTRNLITGTRFLNVEGMLPYEDSVLAYVKGTGKHVLYRVAPVFEGQNLIATGVLMEARSVEDPLVQFCAFCFNVQPGIVIDYATGESRKGEKQEAGAVEAGGETERSSDDEKNGAGETERSAPDAAEAANTVKYIVNVNSGIFHRPDCTSVKDMRPKNRREYSGTGEELIEMGYKPCKNCNP